MIGIDVVMTEPLIRGALVGTSIGLALWIYPHRVDAYDHVLVSSLVLALSSLVLFAYQMLHGGYIYLTTKPVVVENLEPVDLSDLGVESKTEPPVTRKSYRVWSEIYGFGAAAFVVFYCTDMIALFPSLSFLLGVLLCSLLDVCLFVDDPMDVSEHVGLRRSMIIISHFLGMTAWICMVVGAVQLPIKDRMEALGTPSLLNVLLSYVLPLLSPVIIRGAAPREQRYALTRRILLNGFPFSAFIAVWYLICNLAYNKNIGIVNVYLSSSKWPITALLVVVKTSAAVALITAFLNRKNTDILVILGMILFSKEFAYAKHEKVGEVMLAATVLSAFGTLLVLLRYSERAVRMINSITPRMHSIRHGSSEIA